MILSVATICMASETDRTLFLDWWGGTIASVFWFLDQMLFKHGFGYSSVSDVVEPISIFMEPGFGSEKAMRWTESNSILIIKTVIKYQFSKTSPKLTSQKLLLSNLSALAMSSNFTWLTGDSDLSFTKSESFDASMNRKLSSTGSEVDVYPVMQAWSSIVCQLNRQHSVQTKWSTLVNL